MDIWLAFSRFKTSMDTRCMADETAHSIWFALYPPWSLKFPDWACMFICRFAGRAGDFEDRLTLPLLRRSWRCLCLPLVDNDWEDLLRCFRRNDRDRWQRRKTSAVKRTPAENCFIKGGRPGRIYLGSIYVRIT